MISQLVALDLSETRAADGGASALAAQLITWTHAPLRVLVLQGADVHSAALLTRGSIEIGYLVLSETAFYTSFFWTFLLNFSRCFGILKNMAILASL